MPKKDINQAILGMLSSAGSGTRPDAAEKLSAADRPRAGRDRTPAETEQPAADPAPSPTLEVGEGLAFPPFVDELPAPAPQPAPESQPEPEAVEPAEQPRTLSVRPARISHTADVPRTLRLRPATANALREAWLEAKRDDVLLTAQDFASDMVDEMLKLRQRRARAAG